MTFLRDCGKKALSTLAEAPEMAGMLLSLPVQYDPQGYDIMSFRHISRRWGYSLLVIHARNSGVSISFGSESHEAEATTRAGVTVLQDLLKLHI